MEYKTERLLIREFKEDEADLLYLVLSNENIMRYSYYDCLDSKDEFHPIFKKIIENSKKDDGRKSYSLAVFDNTSMEFMGYALIEVYYKQDNGGYGEIGYFLLEKFWGKGYATEIARALLNVGFEDLKLHKLSASCNEFNTSSEYIMKKLRMKKEGVMRKERYKNGKWMDEIRYGIIKEEWEADR